MNAKADQKERTHESILTSAAQLLRSKGISGARVADVMKGAGLTVGGFYAHFTSKESLVDETLRRITQELCARLFDGLEGVAPADRLDVVLRRYLSVVHRDAVTEGCPLPAVVGEVGTNAEEHRDVLHEHLNVLIEGLEAQMPAGNSSRRQRALATIALMYGGLSLARALRGTDLSEEILRACRAFGRSQSKT